MDKWHIKPFSNLTDALEADVRAEIQIQYLLFLFSLLAENSLIVDLRRLHHFPFKILVASISTTTE